MSAFKRIQLWDVTDPLREMWRSCFLWTKMGENLTKSSHFGHPCSRRARASNIQIVIGVRFTGLFFYFVRCVVILVNRKKKIDLSLKIRFSWPNETFILETLAPHAGCAFSWFGIWYNFGYTCEPACTGRNGVRTVPCIALCDTNLLTRFCALHRVYKIAHWFPLRHVSVSMPSSGSL